LTNFCEGGKTGKEGAKTIDPIKYLAWGTMVKIAKQKKKFGNIKNPPDQ
jgi:hypothetical protein